MKYILLMISLIAFLGNCNNSSTKMENNTQWIPIQQDSLSQFLLINDTTISTGDAPDNELAYLENVDVSTFETWKNSNYARDKNRVYYPINITCLEFENGDGMCFCDEYIVENAKPTTSIPLNSNKEIKQKIKKDTTFYLDLRPDQPLHLNKVYKDTFEAAGESEKFDVYTFSFFKDDAYFEFLYLEDRENYNFSRGDIVEVNWKIDTVYLAGEDDAVAYETWIVDTKKLSSLVVSDKDTLSVLTYFLGREFENYHIHDWTAGDINKDGKDDFVVVMESDFTTSDEYTHDRKAVLLKTIDYPKMKISATNNEIVDCSMCSGAGNRDPHRKVVIKNNYFSFESHYGGKYSDYFVITFKYEATKKNWLLHKIGVASHVHSEEEDGENFRQRTKKDFGEITFESYTDIKDK